jgi:hypothetical protein
MMVGVSSVQVKESSEELAEKLRQAKTSREKEKLQQFSFWKKWGFSSLFFAEN